MNALMLGNSLVSSVVSSGFPEITGPMALIGDSITAYTSFNGAGVVGFAANGWGGAMRLACRQRADLELYEATGEYDFAVGGAMATSFVTGGTERALFEACRDSAATAVLMMIGSNDMASTPGNATAEATAPVILELWDELIAVGKQVIGIAPPPRRASAVDAATYLSRRLALIELLRPEAATRGVQFIDPAPALDLDGDGHADDDLTIDVVHPNIPGGIRMGLLIGAAIRNRLPVEMVYPIPAQGSADWITVGAYMEGTPGDGNTATALTVGSFVTDRALTARADGVAGNWQDLTIAGMSDANVLIASPTDFSMQRVQSTSTAHNIGDTLVAVAEIDMSDTIYLSQLNLWVDGVKTQDYAHFGGLAYVTTPPPAQRGFMMTPPWVATKLATAYAQVFVYGNGSARLGRFGVFRIGSSLDADAMAYADAVVTAGGTVTEAQLNALSDFVIAEKAGGRWGTKTKRLYLPIWGLAAPNAIDMVSLVSGAWSGTVTHAAGYSQSNGTTGYFTPDLTPQAAGMDVNSCWLGGLCTQAASGTGFAAIGGIGGATNSLQLYSNNTTFTGTACGASTVATWSPGDRTLHTGILSVLRTSPTILQIRRRTSVSAATMASNFGDVTGNTAPATAINFMAQATGSIISDARLGAFFYGSGITAQDDLDFSANLKTCWEALTGLALP